MRYVLTGATGYVGSRLLDALLADGHEVHCLARSRPPQADTGDTRGTAVLHLFDGSRESVEACVRAARADAIIHVAARRSIADGSDEIRPLLEANTLFPSWLADAAVAAGTRRFLNTGTWWQWDAAGEYSPLCLYSATKQAFDDVLAFYAAQRSLHAVTLVLYDVYGPGDPRPTVLQRVVHAARAQRPLAMTPGEQRVAFLYIDDAVAAYRALLARFEDATPAPRPERFFAATTPVPLRATVMQLEGLLGTSVAQFGELSYGPRTRMEPYIGPAVPGWAPETTLEQGLRRLVDAQ